MKGHDRPVFQMVRDTLGRPHGSINAYRGTYRSPTNKVLISAAGSSENPEMEVTQWVESLLHHLDPQMQDLLWICLLALWTARSAKNFDAKEMTPLETAEIAIRKHEEYLQALKTSKVEI
ncbi:hypothetical protein PIB30_016095 [Stylosanthes scabra]|uniref:Uncharacterized protein n=1 Tax=Stylosanthes scabra TaxID=79078 RepID=A0ABU6Q7Z3_9FABA|nr:hypothetical protein [Stylosanthes scabra]